MTIQEFKETTGQMTENIIANGIPLERKGLKYRCPNKLSHANGDRNPSMVWHKEALQFYCFTCGCKIDIYEYYTKYRNMTHEEVMKINEEVIQINKKENPNFIIEDLKDSQIKYLMDKRGFSWDTITFFRLGDLNGNIGIPYQVEGRITGIKLKNMRSDKPKYLSVTGSEFGILNKDNLDFNVPLVLTEGEFDTISVYESGYKNVVSVGSGGSSLEKLIKNEKELLKKFKALIVFSDNDAVGQIMRKRFLEEFGFLVKFPDQRLYQGLKDANEILLAHGREQILKIIKSASIKIEGLINLGEDNLNLDIEKMEGNYIPTGISSIDYAINDLSPSQVSLITGRSNGGKSTFVSQIVTNSIDKGYKVLLVSGEGIIPILINNIYTNVIGRNERYYDIKKINKRGFKVPKPFVVKALKMWHGDKLTIFSKGESKLKSTDELLKMLVVEIKLNKPAIIIIDNLMSVLSIEKASEKWERQADFIQSLCDLAKAENTHISIVLHPNKTIRKHSSMDFEDISGSSDIYNKADVVLSLRRLYEDDRNHDGEITVLKNRYFNDLPIAKTVYDEGTGMLLELGYDGSPLHYNLHWEQYISVDDIIESRNTLIQE